MQQDLLVVTVTEETQDLAVTVLVCGKCSKSLSIDELTGRKKTDSSQQSRSSVEVPIAPQAGAPSSTGRGQGTQK